VSATRTTPPVVRSGSTSLPTAREQFNVLYSDQAIAHCGTGGEMIWMRDVVSACEVILDSPLSSAILRYSLRITATAAGPGPHETRPFGLRFARIFPLPPPRPAVRHSLQVAEDTWAWFTRRSTSPSTPTDAGFSWNPTAQGSTSGLKPRPERRSPRPSLICWRKGSAHDRARPGLDASGTAAR
jgi:hypothetical protein